MYLFKKINIKRTFLVFLAMLMILPILQPIGVSAAVSGITYYENNFELPLYGATGCPVKDVSGISAGTAFTILSEQGNDLKVKLSNGTETTIAKTFCMINLPDVIPSIKYDITNSYNSVFKIRGANIPGLTGQSLYQNGTSKKNNPRLGKNEFLVPVLYETAIKIATAQKKALSEDYSLVIYEAYRPTFTQDKLFSMYSPLVTADARGNYPVSWFAASGKSNHQEGYAVDISLAKVNSVSFATLSNPAYKIANLTVTNCVMITPIHDLTVDSAVYVYQSGMVIYDKTAWQSYTQTAAFAGNLDCRRLQRYMTDAGLTPFAAEWWHFNDVDARNNLGTLTSITGNWELTANKSILEAAIAKSTSGSSSGDTVTVWSTDAAAAPLGLAHNGSQIHTSDGWYTVDGVDYPAYCVDPSKPGAGEVDSYDVTLSNSITDPKIYGIILAGSPYKTVSELGVEDGWEANLATKLALRAYLKGWDVNDYTVYGSDPNGAFTRVLNAIKSIYTAGMKNTAIPPAPSVTVTATGGNKMTEQEIDGEPYFIKEYTVTSNVQIKSYTVSITGSKPAGTKITALSGEDKTTFAASEKFKVIIPKENVTGSGTITLDIKGEVANNTILYGTSSNVNTQDYAMTGAPFTFKNANATANYEDEPVVTTTIPDEPDDEIPNEPGELEIIKLDAGTNKPLAGAVFEIKDVAGTIIHVGSTNNSGKISLSVDPGYYSVTEITPPTGYTLDDNPHKDNILIRENETTTVTFTNKKLPSLEITKVDAKTNAPLAGATIRIAKNGGTKSWDVTTNSQGKATLEDMQPGTYTVTEIVAPSGYVLTSTQQIIVLEAGKTSTITLKNWKKPGIVIKKYDEDTGLPLVGAEFSIAKKGGSIIYEGITDSSGIIKVDDLEPGFWYTITEIAAPKGYLIVTESKDVYLESDRVVEIKFDNKLRPSLKITKTDSQTGLPLAGAKFAVKKTEGNTVSEYITDSAGTILINDLDEAIYSVWEVEAPNGYVLNTEHRDIQLEWGKVKSLAFTNTKKPSLIIKKYDEGTALPLSGAEFSVAKMGGTIVYEGMVNANGEIHLDGLEPGWYKVTEIAAPPGYLMATESKDVLLEAGKTTEIKFDNRLRPALQIEKRDEQTNAPLAGAIFYVKKADSTTVSEYITDKNGIILIHDLEEAVYSVWEVKAPDGYLLEEQHKDITLEWGKVKTLIFTNKARPALEIKKIDSITGQPLSGVKFKVTKTEDLTVSEYITDVNGTIIIKNLDDSIYTVEEIIAPDGYIFTPDKKDILLEWGKTKTLIFENIRKPTFAITKTNALTYMPIPNTVFRIEYENGNGGIQTLGTYRTDANGQIILPNVEAGWYIITEIQAAPGFSLPSNPVTRKYLAPGENAYTNLNINNGKNGDVSGTNVTVTSGSDFILGQEIFDYPLNSIVIRKAHYVTGEMLAGAVFELRKVTEEVSGTSGTVIGRYTTDNSGVIVITGLVPGGYIVEEIQAPPNFLISENSQQQAWLKPDGTSIIEVTFANIPYGSILITKVDAQTGKPLANARFKVTDSSGTVAGNTNGEYITNTNGEILIPNLKPGSYVVTEIEAPEYYAIDTTPQTVNVGVDGKIYKVSFQNQPAGTLVIRKLDTVTKEPLANAEFKVTTSGGNVVGTGNGIFKTDVTGTITIPHLPKGSYIVEEIKAPNGYILENQSQTIAIDYGKTYTLDFYNKKMSGMQIIKIDSVTKQPLKGVEFTIYKQNGEIVGHYTTDADGVIIVDKLVPGWYKAVETKTLDGYLIDDIPKDFQITDNQFLQLVFENAPMSSLLIRKVDADTREPLADAEFSVKTMDGSLIGIYHSDEDGMAIVPTLAPGWYTVTETSAPAGYSLGDNVQTVEITNSKTVTIEFRNRKFGSLIIKKIDDITGDPLSGANFTVYHQAGSFVGEYTTGKDGTINIPNVAPGWYVISETKAPAGYILNSTAKTVEVKPVVPTVTTFTNKPLSGIEIIKTDSITHNPLAGATFIVERSNGEKIGIYKTDAAGKIIVSALEPGTYIVSETIAPDGYILNETPKTVIVISGKMTMVEFINKPLSGIEIIKTDSVTHNPLTGATFILERSNGEKIGTYKTDSAGKIIVPDLTEGTYIVSETIAPDGYILNEIPKTVVVVSGKITTVEFANKPYSGIEIIKTDSITHRPLSNATFEIMRDNGEKIGIYKTDISGKIVVSDLTEGTYIVSETIAPNGYTLDEIPKTVIVKSGKLTTVEFLNRPYSGIEIIKLDAIRFNPLSGATFTIEKANGEKVGTYRTDISGKIIVPYLPEGVYVVSETVAPFGYMRDEIPKTVTVVSGKLTTVEFLNRPMSGIEIIKTDVITHNPLMGATFTIEKANGEKIGTYKTDISGKIIVPLLAEGAYIVSETIAPDGYILSEIPKTVIVTSGKMTQVEFTNKPFSGIEIIKFDTQTKAPLTGATFLIEHDNGERIGSYKTDRTGKIIVPDLPEGTYIISETQAPDGYILDEAPKTVIVKSGKLTVVEFFNKPLAGLKIIKLDSVTRNPIENVEFQIAKINGEKVENDFRGYTFKTDRTGMIYIPQLENGYYTVTETRTVDGYILDGEPKTVLIQSGKTTILEVLNTPMSGLLIVKTDANTGRPLAGVVYDIKRADGAFVTGNILDGNQPNTANNSPNKTTSPNGDITGSYTTDANGRILLNGLEAGQYTVTERKALDEYELDTNVYNVTVLPGKLATIQLVNKPHGGIRLVKIDSITKKPIYNVEFMLFDMNGKVIGVYYTDNNGIIDFPKDIPAGRYTIRETRAAANYYLDEIPKTVEFVAGQVTEITWTNTPKMGQIQITKKSADANEINGLPKGTPLANAVFEVYNYKTGKMVDRFVSGKDGKAISSPLPLGRYIVKEVQAPQYYILSDKELDIEIEFATQIIKQDFVNYSANTGVSIKKTGNVEAMPGDTIRYEIKEVKNTSTVPLTDFYWRDVLPVDAVRLNKIVTGTYNQSLKYKIVVATNKGNTKVIADNLSTTKNNVIDCSPASLGLKNDEFVTNFTFMFGTVKAGFSQVSIPQIYVDVMKSLPNGYKFSNKVDAGGKDYNGSWVVSGSTWLTTIYSKPNKYPQTGY